MKVTRRALRLGLAVSLMGLFSRVRGAEADPPADALAIDPSGDVSIQKKLTVLDGIDFKQVFVEKLRFWGRYVTLGFQDATLYMRSNTSFAWFAGGVRNDGPMNAGGGTKLMSLNGAGNLDVGGAVTAKTLDLEPMGRVGTHPQGLPLYVTGTGDSDTSGIAEFRHANAEQGIGIGRNTIYAAGWFCHASRRLRRSARREFSDHAICMTPIAMRALWRK